MTLPSLEVPLPPPASSLHLKNQVLHASPTCSAKSATAPISTPSAWPKSSSFMSKSSLVQSMISSGFSLGEASKVCSLFLCLFSSSSLRVAFFVFCSCSCAYGPFIQSNCSSFSLTLPHTGMAHVREARMLCRKTVELFTLLSHTQETGARRMGMTQGLLALVTGLAHYLKILIRIALTGALKLERGEAGGSQAVVYQQQQQQHRSTANGAPLLAQGEAMASFLDKLHLLAVQGGNPAARRTIKTANSASSSTTLIPTPSSTAASTHPYPYLAPNGDALNLNPTKNPGTQGVTYGFRSLAPEYAGESPFWSASSSSGGDGGSSPGGSGGGGSTASGTAQSSGGDLSSNHAGPSSSSGSSSSSSSPPSDLCVRCNLTVEEDCVRLGTYQRWHSHCVQCAHCGKIAAVPAPQASGQTPQQQAHGRKDGGRSRSGQRSGDESTSTPSHPSTSTAMQNGKDASTSTSTSGSTSQPAPKLTALRRPPARVHEFVYDPDTLRDMPPFGEVPTVILCTEHAHPRCRGGFQAVQRLEQYAFLLNVALRRLYLLLKKQGVVPISPGVCLFFFFLFGVFCEDILWRLPRFL